jgi:hypothetical protein
MPKQLLTRNYTMTSKQPASNPTPTAGTVKPTLWESRKSFRSEFATVNGHDYDITGPDQLALIDDIFTMDYESFAKKWASAYRGPSNINPPASEAPQTKPDEPKEPKAAS